MMVNMNVKELRLTVQIVHITTALSCLLFIDFNRLFCKEILKGVKKINKLFVFLYIYALELKILKIV